jgi:hypothetical protein
MQWLQKAWNSVATFISGWKTHLAALALIFVNIYDTAASYWDWNLLIPNKTTAMIVNVVLAALVMVFRQMGKTSAQIASDASEVANGNG